MQSICARGHQNLRLVVNRVECRLAQLLSNFNHLKCIIYFRDLFAKLAAEEVEAGWSEEHEEDIPSFGDSQSLFDDVSEKIWCS